MKFIFLNAWEGARAPELRAFLREHAADTDVFCLQEAEPVVEAMCRDMFSPDFTPVYAEKKVIDDIHYRQMTWVRNTAPLEAGAPILTTHSEPGFGLYTRVRAQGMPLHIVNFHGIPHPGKLDTEERLAQSRAIVAFLRDKEGIHIVGGDFNVLLETKTMRCFETAGYTNLIQQFNIKTTRNRLAWERYPDNPLMHSDYVLTKGNIRIRSFEVPALEISDHLPMILVIE